MSGRKVYRCFRCDKQAAVARWREHCDECKRTRRSRPRLDPALVRQQDERRRQQRRDLARARALKGQIHGVINPGSPYGLAMAEVGQRFGSDPSTWALMDARWHDVADLARQYAGIATRRVA